MAKQLPGSFFSPCGDHEIVPVGTMPRGGVERGRQKAKAVLRCHELLFLPNPLAIPPTNSYLLLTSASLTRPFLCGVPSESFPERIRRVAL